MNEPDPAGGRGKHIRLTPRGEQAQATTTAWRTASGTAGARGPRNVIDGLTRALRALYAQPGGPER